MSNPKPSEASEARAKPPRNRGDLAKAIEVEIDVAMYNVELASRTVATTRARMSFIRNNVVASHETLSGLASDAQQTAPASAALVLIVADHLNALLGVIDNFMRACDTATESGCLETE